MNLKGSSTLSAALWILSILYCHGQVPEASSHQSNAISSLERSLAAMGGDAWKSVGAVTLKVQVTSPDKSRSVEGKWSDDWATGQVLSRREWLGQRGSFVRSSDGKQAVTRTASVPYQFSSSDYDLINIAPVLPAVALSLGLSRANCSFYENQTTSSSQVVVISQLCSAQFYPNKQALLKWTINASSAIPLSVELPIRGRDGSVAFQIVKFTQFESTNGLSFPTRVEIDWVMAHNSRTLIFTETKFHSALDRNEFSIR